MNDLQKKIFEILGIKSKTKSYYRLKEVVDIFGIENIKLKEIETFGLDSKLLSKYHVFFIKNISLHKDLYAIVDKKVKIKDKDQLTFNIINKYKMVSLTNTTFYSEYLLPFKDETKRYVKKINKPLYNLISNLNKIFNLKVKAQISKEDLIIASGNLGVTIYMKINEKVKFICQIDSWSYPSIRFVLHQVDKIEDYSFLNKANELAKEFLLKYM